MRGIGGKDQSEALYRCRSVLFCFLSERIIDVSNRRLGGVECFRVCNIQWDTLL